MECCHHFYCRIRLYFGIISTEFSSMARKESPAGNHSFYHPFDHYLCPGGKAGKSTYPGGRPQWADTSHFADYRVIGSIQVLSLIHISEPTRLLSISYAVFCLKKK